MEGHISTIVDRARFVPGGVGDIWHPVAMTTAKDWRVHYGIYPPDVMGQTRSKPFDTEDQAYAWAVSWVKEQGPGVHAMANVIHRGQTRTGLPELDPVPASHLVLWVGDDLVKKTWPEMSRAEHNRVEREVLRDLGKPDGVKWPTTLSRVEDEPLRVL